MEDYEVSFAVHGYFHVYSLEGLADEKLDRIINEFENADFGALEDIELVDPPKEEDLGDYVDECSTPVSGRFRTIVHAKTPMAAYNDALEQFENADFGALEDIDGDLVHVADDHGNYYEGEGELEYAEEERG